MTNSEFREISFKSIRQSHSEAQIFNLSFDGNITKITEYFITVNLCKGLHEWNLNNNYPYKIEAEKPTLDFYQNCFELFKLEEENNIFSGTLFASNEEEYSKTLSLIRKGKIDITLSKNTNGYIDIAEYIIEVKSVNPTLTKLKQDFLRIQYYLSVKIPRFENSLNSGFIVFIKHINSVKKVQTEKELLQEKEFYLNNLSKHLTNLSFENITHSITTEFLQHSPYEDLKCSDENTDFGEIAYNTYSTFSVLIEIKNANAASSGTSN